jgi:hypothetical protein
MSTMRILGINVKAGALYLAVVEPSVDGDTLGTPVSRGSARLQPNDTLAPADRMGDIYNRISQEIRAIKPDAVALLDTRKHADWKYADAFSRISLIAAVQLACHDLGIPYDDIKTEPVGRFVKVPAKDLGKLASEVFGFAKDPSYWTTGRSQAFAVAATVAGGGK